MWSTCVWNMLFSPLKFSLRHTTNFKLTVLNWGYSLFVAPLQWHVKSQLQSAFKDRVQRPSSEDLACLLVLVWAGVVQGGCPRLSGYSLQNSPDLALFPHTWTGEPDTKHPSWKAPLCIFSSETFLDFLWSVTGLEASYVKHLKTDHLSKVY